MRTVIRLILIVFAFALCAFNAASQQSSAPISLPPAAATAQRPASPATPQGRDDKLERVFILRVRMHISVLDKKGQPVAGLKACDFQVFEDKKPQQIESFIDERESVRVFVGVLMDTSSSTAGKLKFEQEAAMNFIH